MELFAVMDKKIEWAAGFLPQQGWTSQGVGFQVEKAACVRVGDMGGGTSIKESKCKEN